MENIKAKDDKVHYSLSQHQISQSIIYYHQIQIDDYSHKLYCETLERFVLFC